MKYGDGGKDSLPLFYRRFNDIDFYVEDEGNEYFYKELLSKLLDETINVTRVFAIGGKQEIYNKYDNYINSNEEVIKVFILDGDFDVLLNTKKEDEHLYYLDEYCIENYLLEEEAICIIIKEEEPENALQNYKNTLNLNEWLSKNIEDLTPLYACYFYIQKYMPDIRNTGQGVTPFFCNQKKAIDNDKIKEYIKQVGEDHAEEYSDYKRELDSIIESFGQTWQERKKFIDGKQLIFLLRFLIRPYIGRNINDKSLKYRILKYSRLEGLNDLKERVNNILENYTQYKTEVASS